MRRLCLARCTTPLGEMLLASEGEALVGAWFEGQRHYAAGVECALAEQRETPPVRLAREWLAAYFDSPGLPPACPLPPLAPIGTPFQQAVWRLLRGIPYGGATTYGALAEQLRQSGTRAAAQAVGSAVGRNPISLLIPCHRVLAAGGGLGGYAGGLPRKTFLLSHERALLKNP